MILRRIFFLSGQRSVSALATRVQRQSMAPLIAEAAAAVAVLTIFISEVAGIPMMDRNTGKLYHRQRRRPVAAEVLAWGSRGKHDDNVVGAAARGSSLARQRVMDPKTSDSLGSMRSKSEVVVDDGSWTHSAFRAFHEMRAGRPQSDAHSEGDNEEEPLGEDITSTAGGPLRRVGRLTSRIPRSIGEILGQKSSDEESGQKERDTQQLSLRPADQKKSASNKSSATVDTNAGTGATTGEGANVSATATAAQKQTPPVCWHMRGRLTNADTGQTIALVEGVELTRSLAFEVSGRRARARRARSHGRDSQGNNSSGGSGINITGKDNNAGDKEMVAPSSGGREALPVEAAPVAAEELEVDKTLKNPGMWTAFGSLATSKFFMYQDPSTGEPMEHFRNTPVEKKQMVRTYERFSQIVSHLLQPNGRLLVVSEWGGRSVKAETANSNGVEEIGSGGRSIFGSGKSSGEQSSSSFGRGTSPSRRVFNLHFFVEARTPKEERELKRWQDRPFGRWVAFGATPPRAHGCKESYSYVAGGGAEGGVEKPKVRGVKSGVAEESGARSSLRRRKGEEIGGGGLMSYTRYGECPTWYGTGRMCGLDVQARRVDSFESLPDKLKEKVLEVDPEFETGPPATMEECRLAAARERERREEERERRRKKSWRRPFGSFSFSGDG